MIRSALRYGVMLVGTVAITLGIKAHFFPPKPAVYVPKLALNSVEVLSPAVPGRWVSIRVHGYPRPDCIVMTGRDFARWVRGADGKRHTQRQVLASIPIAPFDPPVPDELKGLPVAPYFDVNIPLPIDLEPWPDAYFQTGTSFGACPKSGRPLSPDDALSAFNAPTPILPPPVLPPAAR